MSWHQTPTRLLTSPPFGFSSFWFVYLDITLSFTKLSSLVISASHLVTLSLFLLCSYICDPHAVYVLIQVGQSTTFQEVLGPRVCLNCTKHTLNNSMEFYTRLYNKGPIAAVSAVCEYTITHFLKNTTPEIHERT